MAASVSSALRVASESDSFSSASVSTGITTSPIFRSGQRVRYAGAHSGLSGPRLDVPTRVTCRPAATAARPLLQERRVRPPPAIPPTKRPQLARRAPRSPAIDDLRLQLNAK